MPGKKPEQAGDCQIGRSASIGDGAGADHLTRTERGATAVEYGLLILFIAGVLIAITMTLGAEVAGLYEAATGFGD